MALKARARGARSRVSAVTNATVAALVLAVGSTAGSPDAVRGQDAIADEQLRIGVTLGSASFLGLSLEYFWDEGRSVDLSLGTWALRDVSVSLVGKQYVGGDENFRGYVGLGLWNVTAWQEEGRGTALILRAPVGGEVGSINAFGAELSVSKALYIQRADPEDDTPPAARIVPLPGFYYRWAAR